MTRLRLMVTIGNSPNLSQLRSHPRGSTTGSGTAWLSTWIGWAAGLNWNSAADRAGDAADLGFRDLARNTGRLGHHAGLTDLAAGRVRNAAGANFLGHRAGGVRNSLRDLLTGPRAGGVRNSLRDLLAGPRTGRVRNSLRDRFAGPRAGRVRDSLRDALLFVTDTGVRNLLDAGNRHTTADRVRLLAVTNFLNHAGAADRSHLGAWHPATAGHRTERLWAAGAGARITGRRSTGVLWADGARNLLRFRHPITGADFNLSAFGHWLADGVTDVAIAGFRFRLVAGAADFTAFRFVNRLADRAADVAVAGLVAGLANRAADIAIAGLVARLANRAADIAVAGLEAGLANCAADIAIAGLIAGLADGVTFVTIAGFVHIACARDRNLLGALFVNRAAAVVRLLFPDGFTNRLVPGSAAALGGAVRTTRRTGIGRAALRAGRSTVEGVGL